MDIHYVGSANLDQQNLDLKRKFCRAEPTWTSIYLSSSFYSFLRKMYSLSESFISRETKLQIFSPGYLGTIKNSSYIARTKLISIAGFWMFQW